VNLDRTSVLPTAVIIASLPYYPLFFRHTLANFYHIFPIQSQEFTFSELENLTPAIIIIEDGYFKKTIFRLCREFRKRSQFHNTPILVITKHLKKSYTDKLIKSGANDFLIEPLEENDIIEQLKDFEKYKEMQKKLDTVVGNIGSFKEASEYLKDRFLLNKQALIPIHRAIENKEYISVLFISTDQDHQLTNPLAEQITGKIKYCIRPTDFLMSLGEGNYLIILTKTTSKNSFYIAERIKDEVCLKRFDREKTRAKFTLSIGMASQKKPPYQTLNEMLIDAKNALTRAQEVGNQIIIHH